MKKKKRTKLAAALNAPTVATDFTRGAVATALLAALQGRWQGKAPSGRQVLRLSLQGGAALAAGIATAESLRARDYGSALIALAGGLAGVAAAELLLNTEIQHSAEEAEIG